MAVVAGSFTVVAVLGALGVSTTLYFRERKTGRAAAVARLQAENLLSFVFTDLDEELNEIGHLSLMEAVSTRAVAYYEGLPAILRTRETRASHALAVATSGFVLAMRGGEVSAALPLIDSAIQTFRQLEAEGPLTPFMRVAYGFTAAEAAPRQFRVRPVREMILPLLERGERVLQPAIADPQWGGWAQRTMTRLLRAKAQQDATDAVESLRRAISSAELADRRSPPPRFPGLRTAEIMSELSELLLQRGNRAEAQELSHEAARRLRGFVERAPYLTNARRALDVALRVQAKQALADWDLAGTRAAFEESRAELGYLQKVDPRNTTTLLLAPSWAGGLGGHFGTAGHLETSRAFPTVGEFVLAWMDGDFVAAERVLRKGLDMLSGDWMTPIMRSHHVSARVNLARVYAATGRDDEAVGQLLEADAVLKRIREERNLHGSGYEGNVAIGRNYFRVVPESWRESWRPDRHRWLRDVATPDRPAFFAHAQRWLRTQIDLTRRMHGAGVRFLAGTDASQWNFLVPGSSLHDELGLFVRAGFSPLEALQTATTNAAEYLGLTDSIGGVAPGKRADFLLLDADPTVDIENIRRIHAVVLGGQAINRKQLDAILADARERAKRPAPSNPTGKKA